MRKKVSLRQKPVKGNRLALYLDFYPAIIHPETGKETRREFLGIFLHDVFKHSVIQINSDGSISEKIIVNNGNPYFVGKGENKKEFSTKKIKIRLDAFSQNDNALAMAQAEKARLHWDGLVNKSEEDRQSDSLKKKLKQQEELNFVEFFHQQAQKRTGSSLDSWMACYNYLVNFAGEEVKFKDVTEQFCERFRDYLLTTKSIRHNKVALSQNSALTYFGKFRSAILKAYKTGLIKQDINSNLEGIKKVETQRQYLTQEELNKLAKVECQNPLLKRAALFSALTGLRHCDIMALEWGNIENIPGEGYVIHFKQKKTGGVEYMPISDQAYSFCGERQEPEKKVFHGFFYGAHYNRHLFQWIGAAGITKAISFHGFRNTFAVLQLSNGTDIYTVSKMLGHRDLKTTQHYAQIVDATKRKAANTLKIDL